MAQNSNPKAIAFELLSTPTPYFKGANDERLHKVRTLLDFCRHVQTTISVDTPISYLLDYVAAMGDNDFDNHALTSETARKGLEVMDQCATFYENITSAEQLAEARRHAIYERCATSVYAQYMLGGKDALDQVPESIRVQFEQLSRRGEQVAACSLLADHPKFRTQYASDLQIKNKEQYIKGQATQDFKDVPHYAQAWRALHKGTAELVQAAHLIPDIVIKHDINNAPMRRKSLASASEYAKRILSTQLSDIVQNEENFRAYIADLRLSEHATLHDVLTTALAHEDTGPTLRPLQCLLNLADKQERPSPIALRDSIRIMSGLIAEDMQDTSKECKAALVIDRLVLQCLQDVGNTLAVGRTSLQIGGVNGIN